MKNINKKELFIKLIPLFVTLLCCVVLVSYAYYKIKLEGQKEHFVSSDLISFTYKEGEDKIAVTNVTPISDTDGKKGNYFEFNVSSNLVKDMSIDYEISILKTSTTNSFSEEDMKAYLTDKDDNMLVDPVVLSTLSDSSKITNAKVIYKNGFTYNNSNEIQTHTYRLRLWLKNDADLSKYTTKTDITDGTNITLPSYSFKFKVNVNTYDKTTGADTLIKLTDNKDNSGLYTITHAADSTLQIGNTSSITEYRYRGASPKNYVTFNNEVWRIIGVFPTDDGTGNIENRVKLIRDQSIGNKSWDNGTTAYNYTKNDNLMLLQDKNKSKVEYLEKNDKYGVIGLATPDATTFRNNWAGPATLNTELNTTYLNSLDSTSKSMIGNAKYYLGGMDVGLKSTQILATTIQIYQYERKISGSDYYYSTNPNSWVGKLALMYVSDYGYASKNCENKYILNLDDGDDLGNCSSENWLHHTDYDWFLNNNAGMRNYSFTNSVVDFNTIVTASNAVRPTLYLNSLVKITGGTGTSTNPYTLGL